MPALTKNQPPADRNAGGKPGETGFIKTVFGFFGNVLTSIGSDDFLRVLWGVEVLLFAILAFMILFANITPDQRFNLSLVIVGSVVVTFVISSFRVHARPQHAGEDDGDDALAHPDTAARTAATDLGEDARRCLALLEEIREANLRNLRRGASGGEQWARLQRDAYNRVCRTCHERRLGGMPPDAYFDTICAEPDIATVCERKWELGEAVEVYRARLNRLSQPPKQHDELERLIRRSVTQPDWSPAELEKAVSGTLELARKLTEIEGSGGSGV